MESNRFSKEILTKLFPIIEADLSDSGALDNMLEFLCQAGDYSLPEAVRMLIPEAWHNVDPSQGDMPQAKWDFYKWAANSCEPWDGPGEACCTPDALHPPLQLEPDTFCAVPSCFVPQV
ncbi:unnamed protein product [Dicrocoelium dendriticum]|nr:unnamed protein product [Dicrocoelium dendriticum]